MALAAQNDQYQSEVNATKLSDDVTTADLIHQSLPMVKHKSYTPMPCKRSHAKSGVNA